MKKEDSMLNEAQVEGIRSVVSRRAERVELDDRIREVIQVTIGRASYKLVAQLIELADAVMADAAIQFMAVAADRGAFVQDYARFAGRLSGVAEVLQAGLKRGDELQGQLQG